MIYTCKEIQIAKDMIVVGKVEVLLYIVIYVCVHLNKAKFTKRHYLHQVFEMKSCKVTNLDFSLYIFGQGHISIGR